MGASVHGQPWAVGASRVNDSTFLRSGLPIVASHTALFTYRIVTCHKIWFGVSAGNGWVKPAGSSRVLWAPFVNLAVGADAADRAVRIARFRSMELLA